MDTSSGFDFISASPMPDFPVGDSPLIPNELPFTPEPFPTPLDGGEPAGLPLDSFAVSVPQTTPQPAAPVFFPEFQKLQEARFAEIKEREKRSAQAVQERKGAAAETRKQMLAERAKATEHRKTKNREDEKEFILQRDATLSAGKDWQRVSNLLDVNAKTDSTRMRDVLVKLK